MMNSNLLARFRPGTTDPAAASIYETIRQHDEDSDESDLEERAGLAVDRHNLTEHSQQFDDADIGSSPESARGKSATRRPRWMQSRRDLMDVEEADDDVPASLLIEGNATEPTRMVRLPTPPEFKRSPRPDRVRNQWDQARAAQDLHPVAPPPARARPLRQSSNFLTRALADPKDRALWRWVNVEDIDRHLFAVYHYYLNHGFWSILLQRALNLATSAFVIGFSLFLTQCINYRDIKGSTHLHEIVVPRCTSKMGFLPNALLWFTTFFWITKVIEYAVDIPSLRNMHDFYLYLLKVPEDEIQSISWQEIVSRLMALRDSNPNIVTADTLRSRKSKHAQNKQRMDAQDIANRLMRRDNYMVAMINKDILDMTLPVPGLRNRQLFTRTLEWNLNLCVMDYIFGPKNQVRPIFLKDTHRKALSEALRRRFKMAGLLTVLCAPFLISYFMVQKFFRYFNEYQKDPSQIGMRQYNVLAQWKFREFNELWHLFQRRLNMSHPFATRYLNQFPKDKTVQAARFVTFVSGAIISVLGLATVLDQENFLSFEITPGRTTIFYLGIFGSVWAIARGLLPDDNVVYDSSFSMEEVIDFTHYRPAHWAGRLHTVEVKKEFERLYQMQILIFAEELLSMIFTPFVLWFSLPKCADQIIDFFREFTVHVDGVGYVCSFAEFNLTKPGTMVPPPQRGRPRAAADGLTDDYFATKDQKLEQSYWGFMNDYARNPKTSVQFPYRDTAAGRRKFNMPPPFPGLLSPHLHPHGAASVAQPGPVLRTGKSSQLPAAAKLGMSHAGNTPFQSLLLDPHHQPVASTTIDGGKPGYPPRLRHGTSGKGRYKPTTRPSNLKHDDSAISEVPDPESNDNPPAELVNPDPGHGDHPDSTGVGSDPALHGQGPEQMSHGQSRSGEGMGSWNPDDGIAKNDDSDDDDENDIAAVTGENAGILGLVKQLKRVQGTTGHGPGPG